MSQRGFEPRSADVKSGTLNRFPDSSPKAVRCDFLEEALSDLQARAGVPGYPGLALGCQSQGMALSPALEGGAGAVWVTDLDMGRTKQGVCTNGHWCPEGQMDRVAAGGGRAWDLALVSTVGLTLPFTKPQLPPLT